MMAMGDEVSRSQGGNNNTWCQGSPLGWMIWSPEECDSLLHEFARKLVNIRKQLPSIFSPTIPRVEKGSNCELDDNTLSIQWHGIELDNPDWGSWSHSLSFSVHIGTGDASMWMGLNACSQDLQFQLPKACTKWHLLINTANPIPNDAPKGSMAWDEKNINLKNRSLVMTLDEKLVKALKL